MKSKEMIKTMHLHCQQWLIYSPVSNSWLYLANIIAGTIEMLVKSARFNPYFGFCYIYLSCQSRDKIL